MINGFMILLGILLLAIFLCKRRKELFFPVYSYLTGANERLYNLLSTVKSLFEKHNIKYTITGLTLLSAVEKGKLNRGQSVANFLMPQSELVKLLNTTNELNSLGLGLSDLPDGGIRLSSAMGLPFMSDVAILIYPVILAGNRWITLSKLLGYDEWYGVEELFPTKLYALGNLDLLGPQNPLSYLKRNFWSIGLGASELVGIPRKKWWNIPPRFYNSPRIDEVNGIMLDPRPIPGKQTIIMGNKRPLIVPEIGISAPIRKSFWRRFLWS
jgi:hypothetical protein